MRILWMRKKKWQFLRIGGIAILDRLRPVSSSFFFLNIEDLHVKTDVISVWILIIHGISVIQWYLSDRHQREIAWKLFIQEIPEIVLLRLNITDITSLMLYMSCNNFIAGSRASLQPVSSFSLPADHADSHWNRQMITLNFHISPIFWRSVAAIPVAQYRNSGFTKNRRRQDVGHWSSFLATFAGSLEKLAVFSSFYILPF